MYVVYDIGLGGDYMPCAVITHDTIRDKVHLNMSGDTIHQDYYEEFANGVAEGLELLDYSVERRSIQMDDETDLPEYKELLERAKIYNEFLNEVG